MPAGFKGTVMNPIAGRDPCRFGEIPGFPVGSRWKGRRELCDEGVHGHLSGGIHGRGGEGAFSIVLGYEFTYTGQGGQAPREPGAKWSSKQIRDQEWKLGNLALKMSCKLRKPVRVIRGSTLKSDYAPAEGYRYDGLYMVNEAEMKDGKSGFKVCMFRLVRCGDQLPLADPTTERLPMRKSRTPNWTQKPARSMDSAPVASSSRVQLSGDRAISEVDVAAFSQIKSQDTPMSPSSPTLPSRRMEAKERPHPYKHARPISVPPIDVKRETSASSSGSTEEESESNWLDVEMMKPKPEETKPTIQDLEPSPPTSPELEEGEIDGLEDEKGRRT
ncbi:hypothetical protein M413DRAFT_11387 [Hebeloma cylindrosporum]|uniref:YDG domain-containing protein n=1 Tax=Hebeloma cylindrosporum TaxID=76867 RepID=A0A0C3BUX5_HEBCY|nr:hypothetical protein M413DRAFT_11387 [Hebeloma cylindrosporum h7]